MTLTIIILSIIYAIFDALQDINQIREKKFIEDQRDEAIILLDMPDYDKYRDKVRETENAEYKSNRNWHIWQGALQLFFLSVVYLIDSFQSSLIAATIFWNIHDPVVNKLGLEKHAFFVGTTAFIDKTMRSISSKHPERVNIIAKLSSIPIAFFFNDIIMFLEKLINLIKDVI